MSDCLNFSFSEDLSSPHIFPVWGEIVTVEERHLDVWGHTNNVCYVQWMQDVAVGHSEAIGWDSKRYLDNGAIWVVRNHTIDYRRSTYLGNRVLVQTWIEEMKRFSCLRRYRFVEISDEMDVSLILDTNGFLNPDFVVPKSHVLATASTTWAFISTQTLRPVKIHSEIVDLFQKVVADAKFLSLK